MNYLFYILYAIFIHVTTHILNNISLKKRKVILRNKFIRLNVKVFVVIPTYLFILWKRTFEHIFICHVFSPLLFLLINQKEYLLHYQNTLINLYLNLCIPCNSR